MGGMKVIGLTKCMIVEKKLKEHWYEGYCVNKIKFLRSSIYYACIYNHCLFMHAFTGIRILKSRVQKKG
ncbi:hypothetical protein HanIR_Chr09g0399431 [Helianthus annuus]|nr:hypothetical protein HanIR_Chr09g0399431 [Helianthus annuus]